MPGSPATLTALIARHVERGASAGELFRACDSEGHDLAQLCALLFDPWPHFVESIAAQVEEAAMYGWGDLLSELVAHAGLERATRIAASTRAWRDVDVARHCDAVAARRRTAAAIAACESAERALALASAKALSVKDATMFLRRVVHDHSLVPLVAGAVSMASTHDTALRDAFTKKAPPLAAFESLAARLDLAQTLQALHRFWGVDVPNGETVDAALTTYLRLTRAAVEPLNRTRDFATSQGDAAWWMPILRAEGVKASRAALWGLEAGLAPPRIAELLVHAGYADDDVLVGLLENGIGTRTSLGLLSEFGWSVEAMVRALVRRGLLATEIRAHLDALGVPRSAQRPLLRDHWDEGVLDLTLGVQASKRALSAAVDDADQ